MAPSVDTTTAEHAAGITESTSRAVLASPEFHHLVRRRWRTSLILTVVLFIIYYGYILLVATNKPLLSIRVGSGTLGMVLGISVILLSWLLTAVYVVWANLYYDPEVRRLRDQIS